MANEHRHRTLLDAWSQADNFHIGRYVIMPDHLHLFCSPKTYPSAPLEQWLRYWKSLAARQANLETPLWQREHWDTQLRRGESYDAKWRYVLENPVRAGLVQKAEAWPYQGEIVRLEWNE